MYLWLAVYDITKRSSFLSLQRWIDEIRRYTSSHVLLILVGKYTLFEISTFASFYFLTKLLFSIQVINATWRMLLEKYKKPKSRLCASIFLKYFGSLKLQRKRTPILILCSSVWLRNSRYEFSTMSLENFNIHCA